MERFLGLFNNVRKAQAPQEENSFMSKKLRDANEKKEDMVNQDMCHEFKMKIGKMIQVYISWRLLKA